MKRLLALVPPAAVAIVLILCCGLWYGIRPAAAHGPIDEQIATVTQRIAKTPESATLYLKRGDLYRQHRDWDAALADFDRTTGLDPTLTAVDLARGTTLLEADRPEAARPVLDRFLAKHPHHARALTAKARVLAKLGQPLAAAQTYTQAIVAWDRVDGLRPQYYLERAEVLVKTGNDRIDQALQGLDQGLVRLGPIVTLQLYAVKLELIRQDYDGALARLDTVAAQTPRKERWLVRRGEILKQAGRPAPARQAYQDARAAIKSLPARHRNTRTTRALEAQITAALAHPQN